MSGLYRRPEREPRQPQHVHLAVPSPATRHWRPRSTTVPVLCGPDRRAAEHTTDSTARVTCPRCRRLEAFRAYAVERRLLSQPCPLHGADVRTYVATSETGQCLTCWATGRVLPCERCSGTGDADGCPWCNGTGWQAP